QRPRRPPPHHNRRQRLTNHSGDRVAGAQTPVQRLDLEHDPVQTPRTWPEARLAATRLAALPAPSKLPAPPAGPPFNRRQRSTFQPTLTRRYVTRGLLRWFAFVRSYGRIPMGHTRVAISSHAPRVVTRRPLHVRLGSNWRHFHRRLALRLHESVASR